MSTLEVNKIIPRTGTDFTIGDSGDTITLTSGAKTSGFGKIAQIVEGTSNTEFTVSTPTNHTDVFPTSGKITVSITPSSTSSKILVHYVSSIRANRLSSGTGDTGVGMVLKETIDGTSTNIKASNSTYANGLYISSIGSNANIRARLTDQFLRSPSTTSEITYELGVSGYNAQSVRMNDASSTGRIQVMEILG